MSGFCRQVRSDPSAHAICEHMVSSFNLSLEDMDNGLPRVVRPKGGRAYLEPGRPDGRLEPAEVYAKAIELAELEEERNRALAHTSDQFTFDSPLQRFLAEKADMRIPWLFDDLKGDGFAELLFARVLANALGTRRALELKNYKEGTPAYRKQLALEVFRFIRRSPRRGGLGIEFDLEAASAQRDIRETVRARRATCVEFANLYIAIGSKAGLTVRPVEVYADKKGRPIDHIIVAVELDAGEHLFLDLYDGAALKPEGKWSFISMNDLIAHDYSARSMFNCPAYGSDGSIECKGHLLSRALDFSARHYLALRNMAFWHYRKGELTSSLEYYLRSRDEHPEYPNTRYDLNKVLLQLGDEAGARRECEVYISLTGKASCD